MGDECTIHHIIINPIDTIQSMYGYNSTCIMQTKLMAFPWAFPKVGCKYYLSSSHRHMLYTHTHTKEVCYVHKQSLEIQYYYNYIFGRNPAVQAFKNLDNRCSMISLHVPH